MLQEVREDLLFLSVRVFFLSSSKKSQIPTPRFTAIGRLRMPKVVCISICRRTISPKNTNTQPVDRITFGRRERSLLVGQNDGLDLLEPSSLSCRCSFASVHKVNAGRSSRRSCSICSSSDSCPREWFDETNRLEELCLGSGSAIVPSEAARSVHRREEEETDRKGPTRSLIISGRELVRASDNTVSSDSQRGSERRTGSCASSLQSPTHSGNTEREGEKDFLPIENLRLDQSGGEISESIVIEHSNLRTLSVEWRCERVVDHSMGSLSSQLESLDRFEYRRRSVGHSDDGIDQWRSLSLGTISHWQRSQISSRASRTSSGLSLSKGNSRANPAAQRHSHSRSDGMWQNHSGLSALLSCYTLQEWFRFLNTFWKMPSNTIRELIATSSSLNHDESVPFPLLSVWLGVRLSLSLTLSFLDCFDQSLFLSVERCEDLSQSCGYSVRFESILPRPYGSLFFCTVGVLLRKLESGLRGVSHVIVDEIRSSLLLFFFFFLFTSLSLDERDINTDFLLVLLRDMLNAYPRLKVILMSGTTEEECSE